MPTDTRRIAGPENTRSPFAFCKVTLKPILVDESGRRQDGRGEDNIRPIFLKTGVVSQAQGSAYIELGETKVICAVYGPREVVKKEEFSMKGQITCEFKFATFSCKYRRQHQQDAEEKDFSVQLLEALEPAVCLHKFPKAQVNIYITVLQDDGSALAASISCASVALADAGIEMYDLVTGCSVRVAEDHLLLDPCSTEEYHSSEDSNINNGSVTVGLMPSLNQISATTSNGEINFELVKKVTTNMDVPFCLWHPKGLSSHGAPLNVLKSVNLCVETCTKIYPVLQQSLVAAIKNKLTEKG